MYLILQTGKFIFSAIHFLASNLNLKFCYGHFFEYGHVADLDSQMS